MFFTKTMYACVDKTNKKFEIITKHLTTHKFSPSFPFFFFQLFECSTRKRQESIVQMMGCPVFSSYLHLIGMFKYSNVSLH